MEINLPAITNCSRCTHIISSNFCSIANSTLGSVANWPYIQKALRRQGIIQVTDNIFEGNNRKKRAV